MKNPAITSANHTHRPASVGRLRFEKGLGITFRLSLQKVHLPTQIGCVNVPFAQSNEEINVILHLHRRWR